MIPTICLTACLLAQIPHVELVVLTKDDKLFEIEILFAGLTPTAVVIQGKGMGARIDVKGFKYP